MKTPLMLIVFASFISACESRSTSENEMGRPDSTSRSFDSARWRTREGRDYPYREAMLDDLLESEKLKSLDYPALIDLLGQPDRTDSLHLFYLVDQTRIQGWPLHTTTMVVKLRNDSTVQWVRVHK